MKIPVFQITRFGLKFSLHQFRFYYIIENHIERSWFIWATNQLTGFFMSWKTQKNIPYQLKKSGEKFFSGGQYFSPTNNFTRLKLISIKNFYQLFFLLNKNEITEILKKLSDLLYHNLIEWRWVGKMVKKMKFKKKRKMSHVVASYVYRKDIFYNQTSLKRFSRFFLPYLWHSQ